MKFTLPRLDVALVCSNFDESLHFYRDLLGFEVAMELDIPDPVAKSAKLAPRGFHQVRLKVGDCLIKLMSIEDPPARRTPDFAAGVRWLTLFVEDVRATYDELRAKGVPFLGEPVAPDDAAWIVCAVDPDGVLIELVQIE